MEKMPPQIKKINQLEHSSNSVSGSQWRPGSPFQSQNETVRVLNSTIIPRIWAKRCEKIRAQVSQKLIVDLEQSQSLSVRDVSSQPTQPTKSSFTHTARSIQTTCSGISMPSGCSEADHSHHHWCWANVILLILLHGKIIGGGRGDFSGVLRGGAYKKEKTGCRKARIRIAVG
ncbi:hypothetical protein YC2023_052631 [Brassica napus]